MTISPPPGTSYRRLAAVASIVFALPLFTGAGGAWAQEEDALFDDVILLDAVVVTSTKRDVDPFQINGAIEVATPDELFDRNFLTVNKLDRVFADVNIRNRSSRAYANITIRGQSSNDFYNPTAQLYVDGLPQDQTILTQLLPQGLEQVELLYGPQGTLYGRGAVGGVFNIVTRKPDEIFRVSASGSAGNLDRSGAFLINVPLIADSLFMDAAVAGLRELGEYKDAATGEDFGNTSNWNGRARVRYAPAGSPLDIMLMASHDDLDSDEEQYVSATNFDSRIAFPAPSSYTLETDSYGATVSYDFGFAELTSLTGYQDRLLDRTIFGSYMPESQTTLSQELRLHRYRSPAKRGHRPRRALLRNDRWRPHRAGRPPDQSTQRGGPVARREPRVRLRDVAWALVGLGCRRARKGAQAPVSVAGRRRFGSRAAGLQAFRFPGARRRRKHPDRHADGKRDLDHCAGRAGRDRLRAFAGRVHDEYLLRRP